MTRRPRKSYETPEVAGAIVRMIRALGARAGTDVDALAELARVERAVDEAMHAAVAGCLAPRPDGSPGWSYTDVGRVLGTTRQAAWQRFGRPARVTTPERTAP